MNQIKQLVDRYSEEIYENLQDLVNLNSFSTNQAGLKTVSKKITDIAREHGLDFEERVVDSDPQARPHLLFDNTDGKRFYAFVGHFDTVHPPQSDFDHFSDDGEKLVGPGVLDMKNGILIALYSFIILKELLPVSEIPVKMLFNSDEEVGSPVSRELMESDLKSALAGFIFEPGRVDNRIVTQRKGILSLDIEITGKPSHSGESPEKGINAIGIAGDLIQKLHDLNDFSKGISVQCNEISGGTARNVIPEHCTVCVDIRVPDIREKEILVKKMEAILAEKSPARISYSLIDKRPPLTKNDRSQVLIDSYLATSDELGHPARECSAGGVSDGNILSGLGIPCLDGLGSYGEFPHTNQEYIFKKTLTEKLFVFTTFFLKLLQEKKEV